MKNAAMTADHATTGRNRARTTAAPVSTAATPPQSMPLIERSTSFWVENTSSANGTEPGPMSASAVVNRKRHEPSPTGPVLMR